MRRKTFTFLYDKFTQDNMYQILSQQVRFCRLYIKNTLVCVFSVHSVYIQVTRCAEAALQTTGCSTLRVRRKCRKDRKQQRKNSRIGTRVEPTIVQFAADCDKLHYPLITTTTHCGLQLRQQAWGTGARAPCSLRMPFKLWPCLSFCRVQLARS